jgi:hypothetical protein
MLLVCYSHSSYDDILQVQYDFLANQPCRKYLIYDKPTALPFDKIILYDDKIKYSKRLLNTVSQIEDEFFVLMQDNDILLNTNIEFLEGLVKIMKAESIDILDLKNYPCMKENSIPGESPLVVNYSYSYCGQLPLCENRMIEINDNLKIGIHSKNSKFDFVYNVNPKLVRKSALLDIMNKFDHNYDTIENGDTQEYCKQMKKCGFLSCDSLISNGYHYLLPYYIFLHITFRGKLMPANPISWGPRGMNGQIFGIYSQILQKYNFHRDMNVTF